MDITIRKEQESDFKQVYAINKIAFNGGLEAELVNNLRKADCDIISIVAEVKGKVIGHIMFSPIYIDNIIVGTGLAPLAVLPEYQRKGIGTKLSNQGLKEAKGRGYNLITVIGHPTFYPRFGFEKASNFGLKSQYNDIKDEEFMVLNPAKKFWENLTVYYRDEFKIFGAD